MAWQTGHMKPRAFWVCKISWDAPQAEKATALSPALDKLFKAEGKKVEDLLTSTMSWGLMYLG